MNFNKWNNLLGWLVFAIAAVVYAFTLEPTVSFWDCGEWIATSYKLEVGHPPGAPVYQLFAHLFSFLALGNPARVAWAINMLSAVASGATVMFLFWTISRLIRRFEVRERAFSAFSTLAASFVGAMIFCFSDSFWFSAVEAEVYALSSLFTAVILWAMLRWADEYSTDPLRSVRWLLLVAFLLGVSEGVHFLTLLIIPSAVMMVYHAKYQPRWWKTLLAFVVSFGVLLIVFKIIIPGVFLVFAKSNILFVNKMHLSVNAAMALTAVAFAVVLLSVLVVSLLKKKRVLELAIVAAILFLTGLTPNFVTILRAQSQTPVNEGNPDNPASFYSYWSRDQYPQPPLIYGQYYTAPPEDYGHKSPTHELLYCVETEGTTQFFFSHGDARSFVEQNNLKNVHIRTLYIVTDSGRNSGYLYNDTFCTFFPRMWKADAEPYYPSWTGEHGDFVEYRGEYVYRPSFGDNLGFFVTFQLGHSYFRYFMWNFCGKFNDSQGYGSIRNGAVTTGIPFVDRYFNGTAKSDIPESLRNEGRNEYYAIPLILGILGLLYHSKRDGRGASVVELLFVTTSVGLVFYLNSAPYEPRERDYIYVTSFYAFAIWTGMGAAMLLSLVRKLRDVAGKALQIVVALLLMAVPALMAVQNYDDHNRSHRFVARDSAYNLLMSCQKNAILFTHGDNDTFPLWYLQEVEGIRTDVRIINLSLLNMPWYIDQCQRRMYDNEPLQLSFEPSQYHGRKRQMVFANTEGKKILSLSEMMDFLKDNSRMVSYKDDIEYFVVPTSRVEIPVNTEAFAAQTPDITYKRIPSSLYLLLNGILSRSDLMHYDILLNNDWQRPVYYSQYALSAVPELEKYLQLEGMAYRLTPFALDNAERTHSEQIAVNSQLMLDNVLNHFSWNDLHGVYLDETSRNFTKMLLGNIVQLSETLVDDGDAASATLLWDTVRRYVPEKMLKGEVLLSMLNAYWSAEDSLANALADRKINQLKAETDYYFQFPIKLRRYVDSDLEQTAETMLHIGILAKKHKQEGTLMSVIDSLSPFLEQLTEIYDRKLRFYFSAEDPLHYEDEIGSYIDRLQMLYELFKGGPDAERSRWLSEMLKIHIENYMDL